MIRKFFFQHVRVGKERVFAANHDKQSLYYEKTLSSKAIPIVAKIVVGLGGISVCILPAVWYWILFEEHYKQKFVTDADMRPYRISPPPYPLQAEVFHEYMIRNQTQMDAAEKYVAKVYEERKNKISWRVKSSFAKAAHCQACVSLKSVYFAFLEDSKEDSKGMTM